MNQRPQLLLGGLLLLLVGSCSPAPVQYPPGSAQYPYPNPLPNPRANQANPPQSQPQVSGSQRLQHAWNKAMEGVHMGGIIAGPYGAGGGLVLGFLTGLLTADSYYGELNAQIQTEQQKDQQLEAAIEQELERQRALENQLAKATLPPGDPSPQQPAVSQGAETRPTAPQSSRVSNKPADNVAVASVNKSTVQPTLPAPFKNVEIKDMNGDGVPDLWIYTNPRKPGEILRQEEATKGDGRVDTWSYFNDGKLVRREVDTKGQGRPDIVYYYQDEKIAREERDETGLGRMTYRASYQNGRLAKVEKETAGHGRADLWLYYDVNRDGEVMVKEERDLNGDGLPDLWSFYDEGRLVRRDVSAAGLELLSKQDQIVIPSADVKLVSTPGG